MIDMKWRKEELKGDETLEDDGARLELERMKVTERRQK